MAVPHADLAGLRFGIITALERVPSEPGAKTYWECRCDCGVIFRTRMDVLTRGVAKSCGCSHRRMPPNGKKNHGGYRTAENWVWHSMIRRCTNPNQKNWVRYGGRGIKVCDRWLNSFEDFLVDMGRMPSPDHTIEREDNDKDYTPENCIWATWDAQNNNKRNSHFIEHQGRRQTIAQWARELGIKARTINRRASRSIPVDQILSTQDLRRPHLRLTIHPHQRKPA